jgi:SAM-dependent methyltransferase
MPPVSYDHAVSYYDNTRGYPSGVSDKIHDAIINYTQANMETQFLELAIGTGLIGVPFIESGYKYIGVDISPLMMQEIHKKLDNHGSLKLVQTDITNTLPFPDESFDIINAVRVFHLLDNWQNAIHEAQRVLRQDGYLLIGHDTFTSADSPIDPISIAHAKWDDILHDLGILKGTIRPGLWRPNDTIINFLKEDGAQVEVVDLLRFDSVAISIRMMANRHEERMYSRDWELPDDIHTQGVRRLNHWLDNDCEYPDEKVSKLCIFLAIVAR